MKSKELILPDTIASPQDLLQSIVEVKAYAKWYAYDSIRRRVSKKKGNEAPGISTSARQIITSWENISPLSTRSFTNLITTLESYIRDTETITITLAAPVTGSVQSTLTGWCRKNISPHVFVSFQFNSTLLGGLVVRYKSRVFDWSFKRQLLASSARFPEVLRRV